VTADRVFLGVLVVWALCVLAQMLCIQRYGISLPYCDEWDLTPLVVSKVPITWDFLWAPANEHRAPLTRLIVFLVGRRWGWDWQAMHYTNVVFHALGALALLLAARAVRGRSEMSDVFLCLVVLNPAQFESMIAYGYIATIATGWTCVVIALAAAGWPLRSTPRLLLYLLAAVGVSLSWGVPGNLWALGLCGVVIRGLGERRSRLWNACGLLGTAAIAVVSLTMLLTVPRVSGHAPFRSDSWRQFLDAFARLSVCWMGSAPLEVLWPWALAALIVPGSILLWAGARRITRGWRAAVGTGAWWDLAPTLAATFLVVAMIAYARGKMPGGVWASRYVALTMPIAIVGYLIMVRSRTPRVIHQTCALGMALCVGWSWPLALWVVKTRHQQVAPLIRAMKRGDSILSTLSSGDYAVLGLPRELSMDLQSCLLQLRQADLSIFRRINQRKRRAGQPLPQAWEAEAGMLGAGLRVVADGQATSRQAIEGRANEQGTATYVVDVATAGTFVLWCRVRSPAAGQVLSIKIDQHTWVEQPLPVGLEYGPVKVDTPLDLGAGTHTLTFTMPRSEARLDVVELVARAGRTRR
jgi:hypothetical protein